MSREERADDPSPSIAAITEMFEFQLGLVTATIAKFWGLEINKETPDIGAIEAVLKARYQYWDDNVEHTSYFRD